ncbi:MAG: hypothetical protein ACSHX3_08910 [Litorimonas sp.]
MMKLLLPAAICSVVIIGSATSITARTSLPSTFTTSTQSFSETVEEKFDDLEACQTNEIAVYFHETYVTYHSAQVINDAMQLVAECDVNEVNVTLLDTPSQKRPVPTIRAELDAFGQAHNLADFIRYDIAETDHTTETLNGLAATIQFVVDTDG